MKSCFEVIIMSNKAKLSADAYENQEKLAKYIKAFIIAWNPISDPKIIIALQRKEQK